MSSFELLNHAALQEHLPDLSIHWIIAAVAGLIMAATTWIFVGKLRSIHHQMKLLEMEHERHKTHQATMIATHHYLNNTLNHFQLVVMQLKVKGKIDPEYLDEIQISINKTVKELREFGEMKNVTRDNVDKFIEEHL